MRRVWSQRAWLLTLTSCLCLAPLSLLFANEAAESEARLKRDVTYLASDELEGRGITTQGIVKAAEYIAGQFKEAGLKPGGIEGTYYQPFTVGGQSKLKSATLTLTGPNDKTVKLAIGVDFQAMGLTSSGKVEAPLVFVGYGTSAPKIDFDEYKDLDVAGKVVVIIRRVPRWNDLAKPFDGERKDFHAGLENKIANAQLHKAAAVLLVNDRSEVAKDKDDALLPFEMLTFATPGNIPALHVKRGAIDEVLTAAAAAKLKDLEERIDKDLKPQSKVLTGWSASLTTSIDRQSTHVKNVLGVLEGSGPLAKEIIVIGAHYDHLGYGGRGSRDPGKKGIHHGADDNASGTTSMMELARRFAKMEKREGRKLVFMAFSAEESGLLGSRHYCKKAPLFPLADTAAMVNLDMVGRMPIDKETKKGKLIVEGLKTGKNFEPLLDSLNKDADFQLIKKPGGKGPSDHDSFFDQKIPVLFFWTGTHVDYHKISDTADKIEIQSMRRIVDLVEKVVTTLASDAKRPEFAAVGSTFTPGVGKGPKLGIVPAYDDDKPGLLLDGVQTGGPAAKAGLKAGDRIVEMAGKEVPNITTYMAIMAQQAVGRPFELTVERGGKKVMLKVTP